MIAIRARTCAFVYCLAYHYHTPLMLPVIYCYCFVVAYKVHAIIVLYTARVCLCSHPLKRDEVIAHDLVLCFSVDGEALRCINQHTPYSESYLVLRTYVLHCTLQRCGLCTTTKSDSSCERGMAENYMQLHTRLVT